MLDYRQAGAIHKRKCAKRSNSLSNGSGNRKHKEKRQELYFLKMKLLKAEEMPNNDLQGQTLRDVG